MNARQHANLSAVVGQKAIEECLATVAALGEARRRIVAAHAELGQVKIDIGLRTVATGGSGEKPDSSASLPFQVVGQAGSVAA